MKKSEFIKTYSATADRMRVKNFPNMRLSERVCANVTDDETAARLWRKHRRYYAARTVAELIAELAEAEK